MTTYAPIVGKRILVLEDEPFIAMDIEHVLIDAGAAQADLFFKVSDELYDVLGVVDAAVLDLNIGSDSSIPLARRLIDADIPFVFVSGHNEDVLDPEMRGRPFLTKPINSVRLVDMVNDLLLNGEKFVRTNDEDSAAC